MKKYRPRPLLLLGNLVLAAALLLYATRQSAAAPQTVTYSEVDGQKLQLDIYGSKPEFPQPGLLLIHGGGWAGGSKNDMVSAGQWLAGQGYVCFAVQYRLAATNKNKYPAQVDDCQRAVRWVRAHAREYGVDPTRLGAIGFSAGGHLSALLGVRDTRDNSDATLAGHSSRVQCVIDFFGPTDLTPMAVVSPEQAAEARPILENFFGARPEDAPEKYHEASPLYYVDKKSAPFLIFHGGKDTLVPASQSEKLEVALKKQGVESTLIVFPNEGHGFKDDKAMTKVFAESLKFLKRHLGDKTEPR